MKPILMTLWLAALPALAQQPVLPAGLPPVTTVRPLLERDPAVEAARAHLEVGEQEARQSEASPYEWTPRVTRQTRRAEAGLSYGEWNVAVERGLRLPAKRSADDKLASAARAAAKARFGETLHEAARSFFGLWLDWLTAEHQARLAGASLQAARDNLAAVEKRQRAGDAARLDLQLARADAADQQRAELEARTAANSAWAQLSVRYPGLGREVTALPPLTALSTPERWWRERILSESDELKMVQAAAARSAALAERAHAEQTPDPTVGVFHGSELGGRERLTGISLSVPLPGAARAARGARTAAEARVGTFEVALAEREIDARVAAQVAQAEGSMAAAQVAADSAQAAQASAALVQRAYALGEGDLQTLLAARRQSSAAQQAALQAQAAAVRAYGLLLVDAHLVWDLEHD
ncbi:TolC family protein [Massilia sp. TS11]|uniref:TolC family protein n=1 Tax=Massilia sp. TS11 TaxID=2908003 RepID=UPI001ED9C88B|nr:TolC family protein [Massilia sp. TS11]MCG2585631.1 TolC family protein [Massilia sp. TS11]